jgi:hypothetical protein
MPLPAPGAARPDAPGPDLPGPGVPRPGVPRLGVVVVTYRAADVIRDCLESLLAQQGVALSVVVVDNASPDATVAVLQDWAAGRVPYAAPADLPFALAAAAKPVPLDGAPGPGGHRLRLIEAGANGGFAAGVNIGLAALAADPGLDRFWVLNPDGAVPPGTAAAFATHPAPPGGFALLAGRVVYLETPGRIQLDGGTIRWWTGGTGNLNQGAPHPGTPPPPDGALDFVAGTSMVASRAFLETAGPMAEDYFLYYEEVDWALRRGRLPLVFVPDAPIFHRAGTAIGSPAPGRPATPFSLWFKHRGRMRFLARHAPWALPTAALWSLAKAAQLVLQGDGRGARVLLGASFGRPPPAEVRARLDPAAARRAFGG